MATDLFIIILQDKSTAFFARTESGKIFDITDCQPITDNKYGINYNGVLSTAKQVAPEYVAGLLSKGASIVFKKKTKRRARSKSRRSVILEAP